MQDTEPTQVETQPEVVVAPALQTEMQDVKPGEVPPQPMEQAPSPNQVSSVEIQPVGGETTGEQSEDHRSRNRN